MKTKPVAVFKFEFIRTGKHKPLKAKIELEVTLPQPNDDHEHKELYNVRPLCMVYEDVSYYPSFQRATSTNTLYSNIATCIMCFRDSSPNASDADIAVWFFTPNEFLEWKTPVEVGCHPNKEVRARIIEAAEQDAPLGSVR
ncbi:MAG: hypothetical protein Q7S52_02630 [bacterium]|nr:hypothetical protein [bacterium]